MFFLLSGSDRYPQPTMDKRHRAREGFIGAAAATVAVPAHGFFVSTSGKGLVASGSSLRRSPFVGWMRAFLGACAWAFMIAAGSYVYSYFVKKWQDKGLPLLPVAALGAAEHAQTRAAGPIPLGGGSAHPNAPRRESKQTGFLDEYEG